MGKYKKDVLSDLRRYESTISHEVTHAVRDAMTGNVSRHVERAQKDRTVAEGYRDRGHLDLEFEVDATMSAIATLKRRMRRKWDLMTFKDVEKHLRGTKLPEPGDSAFKKWVGRMNREGLLSRAMREEFRG